MMRQDSDAYISSAFTRFLISLTHLSAEAEVVMEALLVKLMSSMLEGHSCLVITEKEKTVVLESGLVWGEGEVKPLVLHGDRLYLQRYYSYESRLAENMLRLSKQKSTPLMNEERLDQLFGPDSGEKNWQREAAVKALQQPLTIISGGPGTGKTTTVVKIILLLLESYGPDLLIELAAPTGKAAMRMQESVHASLEFLDISDDIRAAVPDEAKTLHRLLGTMYHSPKFRHNRDNPLACEILIVDEASMVDLALMCKLVESLRPGARLILLGDKDQLVSVESGAVLGDLIDGLPENRVVLEKSFRFDANIKMLAEAINRGKPEETWNLLQDKQVQNLERLRESPVQYGVARYLEYMEQVEGFDGSDDSAKKLFGVFNRFRVLCAARHGQHGVSGINLGVELALARRGFIYKSGEWYPGRPVLISSNDYNLGLYNGDVGLCLPDEDGELKVWFETKDGFLKYSPFRLPQCETVFAMTIHKSQGSEFAEVLVCLPLEDSPVLSRELLYTGVTRAKKRVVVHSTRDILHAAVTRRTQRSTGLGELLAESQQTISS